MAGSFPEGYNYKLMPEYQWYVGHDKRPGDLPFLYANDDGEVFLPVGEAFCRVPIGYDDETNTELMCGHSKNFVKTRTTNNLKRHIEFHALPNSDQKYIVKVPMGGPTEATRLATCKYWRSIKAYYDSDPRDDLLIPIVSRRPNKSKTYELEPLPFALPEGYSAGPQIPDLKSMAKHAMTGNVCTSCAESGLDACPRVRTEECNMWAKFKKSAREKHGVKFWTAVDESEDTPSDWTPAMPKRHRKRV